MLTVDIQTVLIGEVNRSRCYAVRSEDGPLPAHPTTYFILSLFRTRSLRGYDSVKVVKLLILCLATEKFVAVYHRNWKAENYTETKKFFNRLLWVVLFTPMSAVLFNSW